MAPATVETMLTMGAMGKALVVEPYLSSAVLGTALVRGLGTPAQRDALLPAMATGERIAVPAHGEAGSRYDLSRVATSARRGGAGWILDGRKAVVLHAPAADLLLVTARTSGAVDAEAGLSVFAVPAASPGVKLIPYPTIDGQRGADVVLSGVALPADALLGPEGEAFPALSAAFDLGVAALCAEAVGVLQATLDATTEYTRTRKQFGVPIARFQALQHRMADMLMHVEQARSMSYLAAMHASSADAEGAAPDGVGGQGHGGAGLPLRGAAGGAAPRRHGSHRRARGEPLLQAAHGHRAVARRHRAPPGALHHGEQMSQAHYTTRGAVAVITLDNPPVNGLGYELRSGLVAGLDRAAADPAVKAIVITGAGKAFSGGADIKEFNSPKALAEPNLHTCIRAVGAEPQAGDRRHPHRVHGRRPRALAGLPLPGGLAGRADRAPRGEARAPARRRRHAAAAARGGRGGGGST